MRANLCATLCHGAIISALAQWPRLNPGFDPPPNLSLQALGWGWVRYSCLPAIFCLLIFLPPLSVCLLGAPPHCGTGNWNQLLSCLIQKRAELGRLIPVMVKDYIYSSFCHCYIGVNSKPARLPDQDKGGIFRFTCSLFCLSAARTYTHKHMHLKEGAHKT